MFKQKLAQENKREKKKKNLFAAMVMGSDLRGKNLKLLISLFQEEGFGNQT